MKGKLLTIPLEKKATYIGSISVFLWGTLAVLTLKVNTLPPFQLLALTFAIGFLASIIKFVALRDRLFTSLKQSPLVWTVGVSGLFGSHACYFIGLKHAPAVEVTLIVYLWPILIVLLSPLLISGEKLYIKHLGGSLVAFLGCSLIFFDEKFKFSTNHLTGYLFAFVSALIWSVYSVTIRKTSEVPSDMVGWLCGLTSIIAVICHLCFEKTVWPGNWTQWIALISLGLGPVGVAFYTWDYGVKYGNIQILATLSYSVPLISTLLLILSGYAQTTPSIFISCLMIMLGSIITKFGVFWKPKI